LVDFGSSRAIPFQWGGRSQQWLFDQKQKAVEKKRTGQGGACAWSIYLQMAARNSRKKLTEFLRLKSIMVTAKSHEWIETPEIVENFEQILGQPLLRGLSKALRHRDPNRI
jgi:hypothetical protein